MIQAQTQFPPILLSWCFFYLCHRQPPRTLNRGTTVRAKWTAGWSGDEAAQEAELGPFIYLLFFPTPGIPGRGGRGLGSQEAPATTNVTGRVRPQHPSLRHKLLFQWYSHLLLQQNFHKRGKQKCRVSTPSSLFPFGLTEDWSISYFHAHRNLFFFFPSQTSRRCLIKGKEGKVFFF